MAPLGSAALICALITALYGSGAALAGARTGRPALVVSARRAIFCVAGLCTLAVILLELAYLRSDFSFALVTNNSSHATPLFYKLTAMWSSQPGSLLLWAFLLSIYASLALHATRRTLREIAPWATAVLAFLAAFFLALMIFFASPFQTLASVPADGNGLSPLLRNPAMLIHPPMLYTGYVGFSIPFAFAVSAPGVPFVSFIALCTLGSVALAVSRRESLRSTHKLDSLLSREAIFLLNNLVLVGMCFVIFWGTFFPLISEAVTGTKASVGPPWFNHYTVPLALVLVVLTAIGPMLAWKRTTPTRMLRVLRVPLALTALALAALVTATPAADSTTSLIMFGGVALVLAAIGREFVNGARARRSATGEMWPLATARLISTNRRRYGGYLVHVGIAVLFLGIAASSAFVQTRDVRLKPGETAKVGNSVVTYRKATVRLFNDPTGTGAAISFGSVLDVKRDGKHIVLHPAHNLYPGNNLHARTFARYFDGESTSEVGLRWGLLGDTWTAIQPDLTILQKPVAMADAKFGGADARTQATILNAMAEMYLVRAPAATFRVIYFPFAIWIWLGGAIVLVGALIALRRPPRARRERARMPARIRPEPAKAPA